jgi:exonuclease VII small subunit
MKLSPVEQQLQRHVQKLEAERLRLADVVETWRERAERAEAKLASLTGMQRQELARDVASRQREACAKYLDAQPYLYESDLAGTVCRATPLVTEVEP